MMMILFMGSPCSRRMSRNLKVWGSRKYMRVASERSGRHENTLDFLRNCTFDEMSLWVCSPMIRWKFVLSSTAKWQSDLQKIVAFLVQVSLPIIAASPRLAPSLSVLICFIKTSPWNTW